MPSIPARIAMASVALAAVVLLSACSGGAQPAAGGGAAAGSGGKTSSTTKTAPAKPAAFDVTKVDPCALFPKDAAQTLVGTTLADGQELLQGSTQPSCTYSPDPNASETAQATLNVGGGAESFYNVDKNNVDHAFTDVPGLGDEAHLERQAIFWKTQGTWFSLSMLRLVDDDHQFDQPLIDAAKAVQAQVTK